MSMFAPAEIEMLEALTKYEKPGCLTASELEMVKQSADVAVSPIPLGVLRKAKGLLGAIHTAPIFKGAEGTTIKLGELKKISHLFAYSSEIDVFEEAIERLSVTIYMMWKVLREKGLVTHEDLLNAAGVEDVDLNEIDNLELSLQKAKTEMENEEKEDGGEERDKTAREGDDQPAHGSGDRPISGD